MRIYLAGPMRSKPQYNKPAFTAAAKRLRELGITVVSPTEMDEVYGLDLDTLDPKDVTDAIVCECIRRDVEVLCIVDAVVLLDDWEISKGATAERAVAEWRGIPVYELEEFISFILGEAA